METVISVPLMQLLLRRMVSPIVFVVGEIATVVGLGILFSRLNLFQNPAVLMVMYLIGAQGMLLALIAVKLFCSAWGLFKLAMPVRGREVVVDESTVSVAVGLLEGPLARQLGSEKKSYWTKDIAAIKHAQVLVNQAKKRSVIELTLFGQETIQINQAMLGAKSQGLIEALTAAGVSWQSGE